MSSNNFVRTHSLLTSEDTMQIAEIRHRVTIFVRNQCLCDALHLLQCEINSRYWSRRTDQEIEREVHELEQLAHTLAAQLPNN